MRRSDPSVNNVQRTLAIRAWDPRQLCIKILKDYKLFEWVGNPSVGPCAFLAPVRKAFAAFFGYYPDKDILIESFNTKEWAYADVVRKEKQVDWQRYAKGDTRFSKTTYDTHDEDHRSLFKIAYRSWTCRCNPVNGWFRNTWYQTKYYNELGVRSLFHENSTTSHMVWCRDPKHPRYVELWDPCEEHKKVVEQMPAMLDSYLTAWQEYLYAMEELTEINKGTL